MRRALAAAGAQAGTTLIEVLVSGVVVIILAVGVFSALEAASASSGTAKSRATATDLGQQDQDRLRALRVSDLSNLRQTNTRSVDGVPYTVVSRADWLTDSTGTTNCSSGTASADYLRIRSTVTWPVMRSTPPVVQESLVAPNPGSFGPGQGSLAIFVNKANASPVSGVAVTASGASTVSDTTDGTGCIVFGYLQTGNYQVSMSLPGYVDLYGNATVNQTQGVVGGTTTAMSVQYDRAAQIDVNVVTTPAGKPQQPSTAEVVNLTGAPTVRTFGTAGTFASTISTGTTLFPINGGYSAYSGTCAAASPVSFGQSANSVTVVPGGAATLTLQQPALNVNVTRNGAAYAGRVKIYGVSPGCTSTYTRASTSTGILSDPGVPFGTYAVCADDSLTSSSNPHYAYVLNVAATSRPGTAVQNLPISTSNSNAAGACT